jgi:hypothetical protein
VDSIPEDVKAKFAGDSGLQMQNPALEREVCILKTE